MSVLSKYSSVVLLAMVSSVSANDGFYGVVEGGYSKSKFANVFANIPTFESNTQVLDSTDHAGYWGVGLGYNLESQPIRVELLYNNHNDQTFVNNTEFTNLHLEETTVNVDQQSLMVNFLYDFENVDPKFTPYLGAGLGISKAQVSARQIDSPDSPFVLNRTASFAQDTEYTFAWNVLAGVRYDFNTNAKLGVGYRYLDLGKVSTAANCISHTVGPICDPGETHSADMRTHSLFVNLNYYF